MDFELIELRPCHYPILLHGLGGRHSIVAHLGIAKTNVRRYHVANDLAFPGVD